MTKRYSTLTACLLAAVLLLAGCDFGSQTMTPEPANRYIISMNSSATGNASGVNIRSSTQTVTAPDTVTYIVRGFTVNKDYTWKVNGTEVPVKTRSEESYVWENRKGEFVTVVFTSGASMTNVESADTTTNTLTVNSPDDNINAETIEITTVGQ